MPKRARRSVDARSMPVTYTTYTIREEDLKLVGDVPGSREEQAKLKWLPYTRCSNSWRNVIIPLKAKFKTQSRQRLGNICRPANLQSAERLAVRRSKILQKERCLKILHSRLARFSWIPERSARGLRPRSARLRLSDHAGIETLPAPVGTWKILGATIWPWFRYDEGMLNYGVRTENYYNLPPGPNNLVGILWMGLTNPGSVFTARIILKQFDGLRATAAFASPTGTPRG